MQVQTVQSPTLLLRHLPAAAAGVPEDTDQAVRQRERRQGRHPQALPRGGAPELQKLLTLLLQKFQPEWQQDAAKDQVRVTG